MKMKAMFLRIGIDTSDKGPDGPGALGPIFENGSFEYIPISEKDPDSKEDRTYKNTIGINGKYLSTYLPKSIENRTMHFDPEFTTFTYGDPTSKRSYLLKLKTKDLLVFYAGLTPYQNNKYETALYIIGYFLINQVIDFNKLSKKEIEDCYDSFAKTAHLKRHYNTKDLVIIVGDKNRSKLLNRAIKISQLKPNKIGKPYYAVSEEMEQLLGISGSIQRSIPPRFIYEQKHVINLKKILEIK